MAAKTKNLINSSITRWVILASIAVTDIYVVHNSALSLLIFLLPIIFVMLHSLKYFGRKHTLVIFAIIIVVSFVAEYLGVHTGKVFGSYFYNPSTKVNGFLIGGVPPLVTFSYVSMGYVCYMMARIILGSYGKLKIAASAGVALIAAMLMSLWDMSFDPVASYIHHIYTWYMGGAYFGVPFRNFTGWFLESVVFFGLINLYLHFFAKAKDYIKSPSKLFMGEVIFLMAANAASTVAYEFNHPTVLQQNLALIALFGMGIPIVIATFRLLSAGNN